MNANKNKGFIRLIILIIIGIIVLSYFNINVKSIVESPVAQENIGYVWGLVTFVWAEYLATPLLYFWNNIFIALLWDSFVDNMERIRAGEPNDFILNAPRVQ